MFPGFVVLFDGCVLYPAPVRDLIIELAVANLYRAKWTERIHQEWIENLLRKRPDLKREKIEKTKALINASVEESIVEDFEYLIPNLILPDPDDRHVLAAAIKSQAQIIVTYNLKDFPNETLHKFDIEAQHPDEFFQNQWSLKKSVFLTAVKRIRESLKHPPKSPEEYIDCLRKHSLIKTSAILEEFSEVI